MGQDYEIGDVVTDDWQQRVDDVVAQLLGYNRSGVIMIIAGSIILLDIFLFMNEHVVLPTNESQ